MYPQNIDKFIEKLNKIDNNTYVIEEEVTLENGAYEGYLEHDNVSVTSINVYSGKKLTGEKINNYILSTPSKTPWKKIIKIFSETYKTLYVTYETQGDTVEAEDINNIQDSIVRTQTEVDRYKKENDIEVNSLKERATNLEKIKADKTYVDTELNKKYNKNEVYNKNETDNRIQEIVGAAPDALDTLKEIADSLNNDADFAGTMTKELSKKVDKVEGKQLSTEDYTTTEKNKLAGIEERANNYTHPATHNASMITEDSTHRFITDTERANWNDANSKKHTHSNKSILDTITQALINAWNNAVEHISDTIKHITSDERTLWNTVSNKVDKITGKGLSTNDFTSAYKSKLDGIADSSTKVQKSNTNGNIIINGSETVVYTHPSGTNPHGTTKNDVGLGNVSNDAQVKRSEMGIASGVATLDANGVNAQAPKSHTHNYAGSSSAGGAANSAVKLATGRGLTIGNTKKTFDGSGDVSWSLSEIGASASSHTHDDRYYTETEANNKFVTKDELGNAGYGDMLKSIYDTNGNGVVDKAESCTGNSATASKLATARGLTIGNTKKNFDGSGDVSWSLSEIGALSSNGGNIKWINIEGYYTTNTSGSYSNQWTKIASVTLTSRYNDSAIICDFIDSGSGQANPLSGRLYFRVKQQNALGSSPHIFLGLMNYISTSPDNFKAVITENTTSKTTVELWFKNTVSYTTVSFIPIKNIGTIMTWYSSQAYSTSLPAGTQISCSKIVNYNYSDVGAMKKGPITWNDLKGV